MSGCALWSTNLYALPSTWYARYILECSGAFIMSRKFILSVHSIGLRSAAKLNTLNMCFLRKRKRQPDEIFYGHIYDHYAAIIVLNRWYIAQFISYIAIEPRPTKICPLGAPLPRPIPIPKKKKQKNNENRTASPTGVPMWAKGETFKAHSTKAPKGSIDCPQKNRHKQPITHKYGRNNVRILFIFGRGSSNSSNSRSIWTTNNMKKIAASR